MNIKLIWGLAFLLVLTQYSETGLSQGVNGYAAVTGISGTTLTVNSVVETDDTFEDGDYIIIMQMQDNVIGNTTNSASFGILGAIQSAGLYEVREILSHTESGGVPATITVSSGLSNSYNINANASVQVITFPTLGSPDYTTTGNIPPLAWNGSTGGVIAMQVDGTLNLAHNISADEDGFRGGANDISSSNGGCENNIYISTATTRARKGEGIYRNTNSAYNAAKGKMLNGGGGGSSHNGGGGGGGNYTAGGAGGVGWGCRNLTGVTAGGQGGISLSSNISSSRLFLGGGGGAGERNNNYSTGGGDGGGIIIIRANEIATSGSCGGLTISANGETRPNIGNDGAPGGGAGGSIFFNVNSFSVAAGCALSIEANGGNGSNATHNGVHGGGGGGGQGVVIYTSAEPTTNVTTTTTSGTGGCANNSNPCVSVAGSGSGSPGDGVQSPSTSGLLPVSLTYFKASLIDETIVRLNWETKSEIDNDYFILEHSVNGIEWSFFQQISGAGNSSDENLYHVYDYAPHIGHNYYRLTQVDFNGRRTDLGIRSAVLNAKTDAYFSVFPNPGKGIFNIKSEFGGAIKQVSLTNLQGQVISIQPYWINGLTQVDLSHLSKGIYFMQIKGVNTEVQTIKVLLK